MSLPLSTPPARPRVPVRTLGALSASVIAFPLVSGGADAGTFPVPKPSRPLPSALDVAPPYQKGTLCLTKSQPGAVAFAKLLNTTYGNRVYGILRTCAAEHGEGRALDWMINANNPEQLALANGLTRWLSAPDAQGRPGAMARRFGINYIIWNRQMWRAYDPARGWAPYFGVSPHTDHIHFSFTWDGAYSRTSWWSGTAVTTYLTGPLPGGAPALPTPPPPPAPTAPAPIVLPTTPLLTSSGYPVLAQGARGADVTLAQRVIGATADGSFGPRTATALATWQKANRVAATSKLDNATWARMVALKKVPARPHALEQHAKLVLRRGASGTAVRALQQALGGITVDGAYGPATESRVKQYQTARRLAATGVTDTPVWYALMNRMTPPTAVAPATPPPPPPAGGGTGSVTPPHPLAKYAGITLKLYSKGEAVKALQKAVGKLTVDGSYGKLTEARVKEYQRSKGLPVTGVTDKAVWNALMGRPTGGATGGTAAPATPASASATAFTPYKATTLKSGSSGNAVRVLQQGLGGLAVDGKFGSRTTAAVKALQTAAKLPATGVVDRRTWDAVERKVHPLIPYWGKVLKRGSRGEDVKVLQRALRITADGSFGSQTEASVKAVQKAARLAQTGVVATLTWRAVEARMPR